ncbi:hypothetical protein PG990_009033 [Apiospora arundinis]
MTVLLVASAAGTLWLYIKSNNEKGLGSISSEWDLVNIWKYLPTVVVVILLAVWHRIDFSTRILQPWANLRKGPASAEDTVFLDLLTPMLPTLIWTASRIKAWPSLITILTVLLMGLVRALSTGLIQVNTISFVTPDFPLQKTANFDASGWNAKTNDNVSATLYYGTWAQGLPWPEWTFGNATFEPLRPSLLSSETAGLPPNSTATLRKTMPKGNSTAKSHNATTTGNLNATSYTAITTGFFPHMECEEAHIDDRGIRTTNKNTYSANITFESSSCKVDVELPLLDPTAVNTWKTVGRNPERSFVGSFKQVACPDKSQRFLASVTLVDTNMKLVNSSSLFCRPSYSVKSVTVQVALPGNQPRADWSTFERGSGLLDNMDPMVLLSHLVNSTMYAGFPAVKQPAKTSVNNDPFLRAASVSLLRADLDTIYLEPFLDPKVMELHIRNAYSGMAAITVQKRMLHAASDTSLGEPILGTSAHDEQRLCVPWENAFLMIGLLVVCAVLSTILVFKRPNGVVPRDPRSIGGVGLILRNSSELHRRCERGLAQLQYSIRESGLSSHVYFAGGQPRFVVDIDDKARMEKQSSSTSLDEPDKMWRPFVLTIRGRLSSIIVPIIFIAVLELIQRLSDRSSGFVAISGAGWERFFISVVPALVKSLVGALFASINHNTQLLTPHHAMASGKQKSMRQGFFSHNLGRLPIWSIWVSLYDHHWAAAFSALGTMLAALLTIVVAGLYSITSVDFATTSVPVQRTDSFGVAWNGSTTFQDGGAAQALSLITWQNLTYPQWTYDDLVFPSLTLGAGALVGGLEAAQRVTVTVPARRAVLDCDINKPEKVKVGMTSKTSYEFTIFTDIKSRCPDSTGKIVPTRISSIFSNVTGFGGELGQLWETGDTIQYISPGINKPPPVNKSGCHSLIFYYGSFPSEQELKQKRAPYNLTSSEAQVTTMACTQLIQEIDVSLSLQVLAGGSLTMDPSRIPVPDERTARYVNDGSPAASNVQEYQVMYPLRNYFKPVTSDPDTVQHLQALRGLDGFYQAAVVAGGLDPASLVGSENASRLNQITNKLYGRYMAQVMHRIMRSSEPTTTSTTNGSQTPSSQQQQNTLSATVTQSQTRLLQNKNQKLILQALLGAMMLCVGGSWWFMPHKKLLPHPPASIAGTAVMLARSGLWGRGGGGGGFDGEEESPLLQDGAEWLDDDDIIKPLERWMSHEVECVFGARHDGSVGVNVVHRRRR